MEVGISSACFYPMPTEQAVEEIARLGFSCVELFLNSESEFDREFLAPLKKRLDACGITVTSVHSYTAALEGMYFFTNYTRRTEDALALYRRYFAAAEFLGARYFTFHGDRSLDARRGGPALPIEGCCEVLSRLADAAAEHGVLVAQENVSWCRSADPAYLDALHRALGGKIGFTLDLKQTRRAGVPWQAYFEAMGDRLVNVHLSDFDAEHPSKLCGEGLFDHHQFYHSLSEISYTGSVLLEVYTTDYDSIRQIQKSRDYLISIFFKNAKNGA